MPIITQNYKYIHLQTIYLLTSHPVKNGIVILCLQSLFHPRKLIINLFFLFNNSSCQTVPLLVTTVYGPTHSLVRWLFVEQARPWLGGCRSNTNSISQFVFSLTDSAIYCHLICSCHKFCVNCLCIISCIAQNSWLCLSVIGYIAWNSWLCLYFIGCVLSERAEYCCTGNGLTLAVAAFVCWTVNLVYGWFWMIWLLLEFTNICCCCVNFCGYTWFYGYGLTLPGYWLKMLGLRIRVVCMLFGKMLSGADRAWLK